MFTLFQEKLCSSCHAHLDGEGNLLSSSTWSCHFFLAETAPHQRISKLESCSSCVTPPEDSSHTSASLNWIRRLLSIGSVSHDGSSNGTGCPFVSWPNSEPSSSWFLKPWIIWDQKCMYLLGFFHYCWRLSSRWGDNPFLGVECREAYLLLVPCQCLERHLSSLRHLFYFQISWLWKSCSALRWLAYNI